ncbi:FkbM family methyltransferase [bacterium]|nr:FkbM family methyltransferase [bacterium]
MKKIYIIGLICSFFFVCIQAKSPMFASSSLKFDAACGDESALIINLSHEPQEVLVSCSKKQEGRLLPQKDTVKIQKRSLAMFDMKDVIELDAELSVDDGSFYLQYVDEKSKVILDEQKLINIGSNNSLSDYKTCFVIGESFDFAYKGINFKFVPTHPKGLSIKVVISEVLNGEYNFEGFSCNKGDVMVDIGAHVGIISIIYAKCFPELTVYAFEPVYDNYLAMLKNIELNNVKNIIPVNMAVTGDGRDVQMACVPWISAGGVQKELATLVNSSWPEEKFPDFYYDVQSLTIESIFKAYNIKKCKFLKIDCEGSEYEILLKSPLDILKNTEYLAGEFHITNDLANKGYSIQGLIDYCIFVNPNLKMNITPAFLD